MPKKQGALTEDMVTNDESPALSIRKDRWISDEFEVDLDAEELGNDLVKPKIDKVVRPILTTLFWYHQQIKEYMDFRQTEKV